MHFLTRFKIEILIFLILIRFTHQHASSPLSSILNQDQNEQTELKPSVKKDFMHKEILLSLFGL